MTAGSRTIHKSMSTSFDAPRCPKCEYLLLGLTEYRCPECGTSFAPEYLEDASFRIHLLPWERPEVGGLVGRLARTLVQASLHPGCFLANVSKRKKKRIRHATRLIAACVLVSLCFHAAAFLLSHTVFFVHLLVIHDQPSLVPGLWVSSAGVAWLAELLFPLTQILSVLLSIVVIAVVISWVFRGKLASLRALDIAAVYSPAIAFGAFIVAFARAVVAVSLGLLSVAWYGAVLAQTVVLLLLLWLSCRRLLSLGRWKSVGMLIIGGVLVCVCGAVVTWLFAHTLLLVTTPQPGSVSG